MALAKDIVTKTGITAGYWKITGMSFNYPIPNVENGCACTLKGWQNQADREQYAPIDQRTFVWTGDTAPTDRATAYEAIKQTDEFAGATDC